jgi:hypothetical protein
MHSNFFDGRNQRSREADFLHELSVQNQAEIRQNVPLQRHNARPSQASSSGGTGLTTSEMTGANAEANLDFDFTTIWATESGSYPDLREFS